MQYDIPTYLPLTSNTPFILDYVQVFQAHESYKYMIQPLALTPPLRSVQELANWYNRTTQSWALSYTIAGLDGAESVFTTDSVSTLQDRISTIMGSPYVGLPVGLLPPRLHYLMFYRKDVFAAKTVSGVPLSWDHLLDALRLVNGKTRCAFNTTLNTSDVCTVLQHPSKCIRRITNISILY